VLERRLWLGVTHQALHLADVVSMSEEPCAVGTAQVMGSHRADPCLLSGGGEHLGEVARGEPLRPPAYPSAVAGREERTWMPPPGVHPPLQGQQDTRGEGELGPLVPLAHEQQAPLAVEVSGVERLDRELDQLAAAQPAAEPHSEHDHVPEPQEARGRLQGRPEQDFLLLEGQPSPSAWSRAPSWLDVVEAPQGVFGEQTETPG